MEKKQRMTRRATCMRLNKRSKPKWCGNMDRMEKSRMPKVMHKIVIEKEPKR